jgi:hypothetical protein
MDPTGTRYALLVRLAWELRSIRTSSMLVIPGHTEPVLYVPVPGGGMDAVLAGQDRQRWRLLWRGTELDPVDLRAAAGRIATGAQV